MCGICGILNHRPVSAKLAEQRIRRMCAEIIHRGPDDQGLYVDGTISLGMRRLSIIDRDGGAQPIFNEDQTVAVVFNGEIYNFQELRTQLEVLGHRFATRTDTEVLPHLYEQYGSAFPEHLNGMFAIALWDARRRRLVLVRDRLGVKPLYYALVDQSLVFGSEIKCLLQNDAVARVLDPQALYDYFALGYIPQPRSIYRDVRKLPPGGRLVADAQGIEIDRYWTTEGCADPLTNREEAREKLRFLLEDATRIRMISDVPLGAFLSGGVDSSIIVALMAQLSSGPIRTFFIDLEESAYSERVYARAVAQRYGTEHHELVMKPSAVGIVDELVQCFDEPFSDSSAVPTYYLSKLSRQHVTVALAGDGGDESFGGYGRYRKILKRADMPLLRRLLGPIGGAIHSVLPRRAPGRQYLRSLGMDNARCYACGVRELEARDLLSPDLLKAARRSILDEVGKAYAAGTNGARDRLAPYASFDLASYLPDDILTKVDRTSMAHSLEVRAPFLDYRVVEHAARMPVSWKIADTDTKVVLKETFAADLPPVVVAPRKRGFSIPLAEWFRNELRPHLEEVLHDRELAQSGLLRMREIQNLAHEHFLGVRNRKGQLWRILFFARWWHAHHCRLDAEREG